MTEPFWRTKRLDEMTPAEWESLCDGCGLCCLERFHLPPDKVATTDVACKLLNCRTARCSDYAHRSQRVKHCVGLTPEVVAEGWLPGTCAYRLVHEGKSLKPWHHLISGSKKTVHQLGIGAANRVHLPVRGRKLAERVVSIETNAINRAHLRWE